MRKSRFTESQIVAILKQTDGGVPIKDVVRQHGISVPTYYKWKSRYGGMDVAELARVRELEAENSKLKRLYAEQALEIHALKDVIAKKAVTPSTRREVATVFRARLVSAARVSATRLARSAWYRPISDRSAADASLIDALQAVIARHGRWGFWKCFRRLRLDGHRWNHKRMWRVYCQLKLNLPRRTKKRLPLRERQTLAVPAQANTLWSMDFMADTLYGGRRFRTFNVLDEGVREALTIEVDTSLRTERVIRVLEQLKQWRGLPQAIRCDYVLTLESSMKCGCEATRAPGAPDQSRRITACVRSRELPRLQDLLV